MPAYVSPGLKNPQQQQQQQQRRRQRRQQQREGASAGRSLAELEQQQLLPAVLETYQHTQHFDQRQQERSISDEDVALVLRDPDFVKKQHKRDKYVKTLDGNRTITVITQGSLSDLLVTTYASSAPVVVVFLCVPDGHERKLLTTVCYPCGTRWPALDILGSIAQFKLKGLSPETPGSQRDTASQRDESILYHEAQFATLKSSSILLDVALFKDAMAVEECINAAEGEMWSQNRHGDKLVSLIADIDPGQKLVPRPFTQELARRYSVRNGKQWHDGKKWDEIVRKWDEMVSGKFENSIVWVLEDGDDDERSLAKSSYDYVRAINRDACGSCQSLSARALLDRRDPQERYLGGGPAAAGVLDVDELDQSMRANTIDSMRGNDELFMQATLSDEPAGHARDCGKTIRARVPKNDVGFNREGLQSIRCRYALKQEDPRRDHEPEVQPEPEPDGATAPPNPSIVASSHPNQMTASPLRQWAHANLDETAWENFVEARDSLQASRSAHGLERLDSSTVPQYRSVPMRRKAALQMIAEFQLKTRELATDSPRS